MLHDIAKLNEQYIVENPLGFDSEKYYIKIDVGNIFSKKEYTLDNDFPKFNNNNKSKAILSLLEVLKLHPNNKFIERKIKYLTQENEYVEEMSDKEALYLALTDKYGL